MTNPTELVHAYHDAFNRREDAYEKLLAPDFILTVNGVEMPPGHGPKRGFDKMWWDGAPDMTVKPTSHLTDGNLLILENRAIGTHTGPLVLPDRTLPPKGNKFDLRFSAAFEFANGKITRQRMYFDRLTILIQAGAM